MHGIARHIFLLVALTLHGCGGQPGPEAAQPAASQARGNGYIVGTISIEGYVLPGKPMLRLSQVDGRWIGQVKQLGTRFEIPARHARLIVFSVPQGMYRVDGTRIDRAVSIPIVPGAMPGELFVEHEIGFTFPVLDGKITYIGDLLLSFEGRGPKRLDPEVTNVAVTDRFAEDSAVFATHIPQMEQREVLKREGLVAPDRTAQ